MEPIGAGSHGTRGSQPDRPGACGPPGSWPLEALPAAASIAASPAGEVPWRAVSTWRHGLAANAAAAERLRAGGSSLDAVEAGVRVTEAEPENLSVGLGGLPDREGLVTLDAAIMDHDGRCGGVCFVQGVKHPISLARLVMERTPHVLLAGAGAERFAREQGIEQVPPALSPSAAERFEEWRRTRRGGAEINIENRSSLPGGRHDHDTIGMLAIDRRGRLAGACTTSGLAFKIHGRVGDSPIVGAGLYVDGEAGAATCTGLGETVLRTLASFLAVERMRQGDSPQQACEAAIARVISKTPDPSRYQVGIVAMSPRGEVGAYAVQAGFDYAVADADGERLRDSAFALSP